jgi:hypothetical protein
MSNLYKENDIESQNIDVIKKEADITSPLHNNIEDEEDENIYEKIITDNEWQICFCRFCVWLCFVSGFVGLMIIRYSR